MSWKWAILFSKKELSQNISPYMVKITKKKFLKKLKKSVDNILKLCYYRLNGNGSNPGGTEVIPKKALKKIWKNFKKSVDKHFKRCYNNNQGERK